MAGTAAHKNGSMDAEERRKSIGADFALDEDF